MINGIINAFSGSPEILQQTISELDTDSDPSTIINQIYWLNKKRQVIVATRSLLTMVTLTACYFDKIPTITAIGFSIFVVLASTHKCIRQSAEQNIINSIFHTAHEKIEMVTKINASLLAGKDLDVLQLCHTAKLCLKKQQKIATYFVERALHDSSGYKSKALLKIIIRTKGAIKTILIALKQDLESDLFSSV